MEEQSTVDITYFSSAQPTEIFKLIFSFLGKKEFDVLLLTSKWLYEFLHKNMPEIWQDLIFDKEKIDSILQISSTQSISKIDFTCRIFCILSLGYFPSSEELFYDFLHENIPENWEHLIPNDEQIELIFQTLSLKKYSKLTSLKITGVNLARRNLVRLFKFKFNLKSLTLKGNKISNEGKKVIVEMLEVNTTLTRLDLRKNNMFNCIWTEEPLKFNTTLSWDFSSNQTNNKRVLGIAQVLEINMTLKYLNLSSCNIGTSGAEKFAKALKVNTGLIWLDLSENHIGDVGVIEIAQALKVNTILKHLDLSHNFIRKDGPIAIAGALKVNSTLERLNLRRENQISIKGKVAIMEASKLNNVTTIEFD